MDQGRPDDATLSAAKVLAQEIARSFGVRARAGGSLGVPEWPATYFEMKAKHRGATIIIEVSDRGCNLTGPLSGRAPIFSLNRPIHGTERVRGQKPELPVELFLHKPADAERVVAYLLEPDRRRAIESLALTGEELFAVGTDRFYLLHLSRDVRALHDRLDQIAQLIPAAKPLRLITSRAHRIKVGRSTPSAATMRSGHSWGGTLEQPAMCTNCKAPAHLLLTIDPTDRALGLETLGRDLLRIVFCLDCMGFPSLTYVDHSTAHPRIVRQDAEERHDATTPLDARDIELVPQKSATGSGSKVGGSPKWVQQPEIPDCIGCGEPMGFLAQIASTPTLSFVDDGMLYTFVCARCRMMASLVQSH